MSATMGRLEPGRVSAPAPTRGEPPRVRAGNAAATVSARAPRSRASYRPASHVVRGGPEGRAETPRSAGFRHDGLPRPPGTSGPVLRRSVRRPPTGRRRPRLRRGRPPRRWPGQDIGGGARCGRGAAAPGPGRLERPSHLSYPFVFWDQGDWYMLPETAGTRSVELLRARDFPRRWEWCGTLRRRPRVGPEAAQARGALLAVRDDRGAGGQAVG